MSVTTLNNVNLAAVGALTQAVKEQPAAANTTWSAAVTWKGGFRADARIGEHVIHSDEPSILGGDGTAPNPVEQLIAALGSCLAVGYAANATAKNIELRELRIDLRGDLNIKTFLGLDADGNAGYESIRADVHIKSDASESQIKELHEQVVATSPVGHTLSKAVPLSINLAD